MLVIARVDLIVLAKVLMGDHSSDIETRIRTIIMSYIKHPNSPILVVTSANVDLESTDQMAENANYDEYGYLLTLLLQLDIMDMGTDARNFFLGKLIPLRLGYVGVMLWSSTILGYKIKSEDCKLVFIYSSV
ncbi:dynamin-related protein 3b [Phtheirospermum japonicum]|uniref:Dynamin-related protein 3b n=1 Tax=Phtheirospermum japonicum TaxID=374723 RepID=A0A830BN59_9LAMI|nr:dynamin-related protein 3b [Phtheirospermum japonicum]